MQKQMLGISEYMTHELIGQWPTLVWEHAMCRHVSAVSAKYHYGTSTSRLQACHLPDIYVWVMTRHDHVGQL